MEHRALLFHDVEFGFMDNLKVVLQAARFYSANPLINDSIFPIPEPRGRVRVSVVAVTFEEDMTVSRTLTILEKENLIPLSWHNYVEFFQDKRSWNYNTIVCLSAIHGENPLCPGLGLIPVVHHFPSKANNEELKRVMDVARLGQIWPANTLFPAVLKGTLPE